jgi:multidrug transporter EmrE-like cation transporter
MTKILVIPLAACISAFAQIMLKKSSVFTNWSRGWILFMLLSCVLYGIALLLYQHLLRLHPIHVIYPVLTLLVIIIVTVYGFLIGERISLQHLMGLTLGLGSMYLLLA